MIICDWSSPSTGVDWVGSFVEECKSLCGGGYHSTLTAHIVAERSYEKWMWQFHIHLLLRSEAVITGYWKALYVPPIVINVFRLPVSVADVFRYNAWAVAAQHNRSRNKPWSSLGIYLPFACKRMAHGRWRTLTIAYIHAHFNLIYWLFSHLRIPNNLQTISKQAEKEPTKIVLARLTGGGNFSIEQLLNNCWAGSLSVAPYTHFSAFGSSIGFLAHSSHVTLADATNSLFVVLKCSTKAGTSRRRGAFVE